MPEPLESELAGVTLESDALPQEDSPPGDLRRRPEAPGHLGQAAAAPTHGLHQVDNESSLLNYEFEAGRGEALQTPAPSGSQTAPTATAVGVVGVALQQFYPKKGATRPPARLSGLPLGLPHTMTVLCTFYHTGVRNVTQVSQRLAYGEK
jgi:hypothetical protein